MANGTHRGGRKRLGKPKGRNHKPKDAISVKIKAGLVNTAGGQWVQAKAIRSGKVEAAAMAAMTKAAYNEVDNLSARRRRGTVHGHANWQMPKESGGGCHQA